MSYSDADPVGRGLVASLARPGGNVTGLSLQSTDLVGKRIELLRDIVPSFRGLAALGNVGFAGAVLAAKFVVFRIELFVLSVRDFMNAEKERFTDLHLMSGRFIPIARCPFGS